MIRFLPHSPLCCFAALLVLATTTASARAQYYTYGGYAPRGYYPNGIYGPGYGYGTGYGNYLQGVASVQDAYGNLGLQSEQARILREQAEQEKLVTKRKTFDELNYERALTPPFVEKMEKTEALKVRRALGKLMPGEVTSGTALNTLLPYLTRLAQQSNHGAPRVPINQKMLKQINVSSGTTATGVGVLKDGGKVTWPFALRGPAQEALDPLLEKSVALASQDRMTPALYTQITKSIENIYQNLRKQFQGEEIDGAAFLEGQHFVESLKDSVTLLKAPNASQVFHWRLRRPGRDSR